ncbi:D-amino acid oxidase [Mariannaea sp. PMI_226]|nr:D-amino acid oxidase [Mariannaea sp. PMI_226]
MSSNKIVVLGAGVIGLTTALALSNDSSNQITVVAKHMPGDYNIEYCSPWAGASFFPVGKPGTQHADWERDSWYALKELAEKNPEAGIHFQPLKVYARRKDEGTATGNWFSALVQKDPWFKDVVDDFKEIPQDQLARGIHNGSQFTSVCINTTVYLPWLLGQCRRNGVTFKRATVKHITEAAHMHHSSQKADQVVNCTGLSSMTLGGVLDDTLYPIRGQVVLVENDPGSMYTVSGCDDGDDEAVYMMTRGAGGGTILGGSYQKGNWGPTPDPNLSSRIMKRAIELCPDLVGKGQGIEGLNIVRHGVGLRPVRENGPRVERDRIDGLLVVHNYGHGGFGYQASFGCAATVVGLVNEARLEKHQAKL